MPVVNDPHDVSELVRESSSAAESANDGKRLVFGGRRHPRHRVRYASALAPWRHDDHQNDDVRRDLVADVVDLSM